MNVLSTALEGVLILEPDIFEDCRGFFKELYNAARYRELGIDCEFVQDNLSRSRRGILRGLHYQIEHPQGKLVQVVRGEVFDVAVDLRHDSDTFGEWIGVHLTELNHRQLFVPPGLAHGFCTLSDVADLQYKCSDYYDPASERTIAWDDSDLGIEWPIESPQLSDKDKHGLPFRKAPYFTRP